MCDGEGNGLVILEVIAEEKTGLPREFDIKLKNNEEEVPASCSFELPTDLADTTNHFYFLDEFVRKQWSIN